MKAQFSAKSSKWYIHNHSISLSTERTPNIWGNLRAPATQRGPLGFGPISFGSQNSWGLRSSSFQRRKTQPGMITWAVSQSPCYLPEYWLVNWNPYLIAYCNPYINWVLVGSHFLYTANKQGEMMTAHMKLLASHFFQRWKAWDFMRMLWRSSCKMRQMWLACRKSGVIHGISGSHGKSWQKNVDEKTVPFSSWLHFFAREIWFMILVNGTSWRKIDTGRWKFGTLNFPFSFQPSEFSSTLRWQPSKKMVHHSTVHFSIPPQWLVWSHPVLFCRSVLVSSHYLGAWVPAASNCFLNYGSASEKPSVCGKMVA